MRLEEAATTEGEKSTSKRIDATISAAQSQLSYDYYSREEKGLGRTGMMSENIQRY